MGVQSVTMPMPKIGTMVSQLSPIARAKYRKEKGIDTSKPGWYRRTNNLQVTGVERKPKPTPSSPKPKQEASAASSPAAADQIERERAAWAAVVNAERDLLDKSHRYQEEFAAYYNRTPLKNAADETERRRHAARSTSGGTYPYNTNTDPCTHNRREVFGLDVRTLQPCSSFEHRYGHRTDLDPNSIRVDFHKFSKGFGGGPHRT